MKKIIFLCLVAIFSICASAMNYFQKGMVWEVYVEDVAGLGFDRYIKQYSITGDTICDGADALVMYCNDEDSSTRTVNIIRTEGDKVYTRNISDTDWVLLYDFGLAEGELCKICIPWSYKDIFTYVKNVGVIEDNAYEGFEVMQMEEFNEDGTYAGTGKWLKGLGSLRDPLIPGYFEWNGFAEHLKAAYLNGEQVYPSQSGITTLEIETDLEKEEYYNLQGVQVSRPESGEILIRVKGDKSTKIVF